MTNLSQFILVSPRANMTSSCFTFSDDSSRVYTVHLVEPSGPQFAGGGDKAPRQPDQQELDGQDAVPLEEDDDGDRDKDSVEQDVSSLHCSESMFQSDGHQVVRVQGEGEPPPFLTLCLPEMPRAGSSTDSVATAGDLEPSSSTADPPQNPCSLEELLSAIADANKRRQDSISSIQREADSKIRRLDEHHDRSVVKLTEQLHVEIILRAKAVSLDIPILCIKSNKISP